MQDEPLRSVEELAGRVQVTGMARRLDKYVDGHGMKVGLPAEVLLRQGPLQTAHAERVSTGRPRFPATTVRDRRRSHEVWFGRAVLKVVMVVHSAQTQSSTSAVPLRCGCRRSSPGPRRRTSIR